MTGPNADPLAAWRREFPILDRCTYLVSHSLGAMPRTVTAQLAAYADLWAERGVPTNEEGYFEDVSFTEADAAEAVHDLHAVDTLNDTGLNDDGEPVAVRAFRSGRDGPLNFRFKLYRRGAAVPLSDVLPILADMGLKTLEEWGNALHPRARPKSMCMNSSWRIRAAAVFS